MRHADVLRAIENLPQDDFNQRNFALVDYRDQKGEQRPLAPKPLNRGFLILRATKNPPGGRVSCESLRRNPGCLPGKFRRLNKPITDGCASVAGHQYGTKSCPIVNHNRQNAQSSSDRRSCGSTPTTGVIRSSPSAIAFVFAPAPSARLIPPKIWSVMVANGPISDK